MTVGLERALHLKYLGETGQTVESDLFSAIRVIPEKIDTIKKQIIDAEKNIDLMYSSLLTNIKESKRTITESIVRKNKESAVSRLYIQELLSNEFVVKNGSLYGTPKGDMSASTLISVDKIEYNYVYKNGEIVTGNSVPSSDGLTITVNPTRQIIDKSTLVVDISLKSKEVISSILISTSSIYKKSIYYYSYEKSSFIMAESSVSSYGIISNDIYSDKIRITIELQDGSYSVVFKDLKLARMSGSKLSSFDILQQLTEEGTGVEVVRCDSDNSNIEYLVSTNGRVFKNATESPVAALGIEDGDIIGSSIINRYRANGREMAVFSTSFSLQEINSNYWKVFTGLGDYNVTYSSGIPVYEAIAIYKDIFNIHIPQNEIVYIDNKKVSGDIVIYPGVKRVKIVGQVRPYDLKYYKGISYKNNIITLTKLNGGTETIGSQNNIFAQIDSTASYIFSSIGEPIFNNDNNIEYTTNNNYIYIGYYPVKTKIDTVKVRILFKNSNKTARIDHLAIKIY